MGEFLVVVSRRHEIGLNQPPTVLQNISEFRIKWLLSKAAQESLNKLKKRHTTTQGVPQTPPALQH